MRARVVWYRCAIGHCSVRYGVAKASPLGKLAKISDFCLMRAVLHLKYPERFGELVPGYTSSVSPCGEPPSPVGKALARLEEILRSGNDLEMTLISIGVAVASLAVGTLARKFWVWKRSASSAPRLLPGDFCGSDAGREANYLAFSPSPW